MLIAEKAWACGTFSTAQLGEVLPETLAQLDYDFPFSDQWVQLVQEKKKHLDHMA